MVMMMEVPRPSTASRYPSPLIDTFTIHHLVIFFSSLPRPFAHG